MSSVLSLCLLGDNPAAKADPPVGGQHTDGDVRTERVGQKVVDRVDAKGSGQLDG